MNPKRILFLARGGALDGAERQLAYLCSALDSRRFLPTVCLDAEGPLADELRRQRIPTQIFPMRPWRSLRGILHCPLDAHRIARIARHHRIDLVHGSDLWKTRYALFTARHLRIPAVIHVRGPLQPRDILKHQLSRAAGILAISEGYRDDLLSVGIPAERIHIAHDAVDIARFRPDPVRREALRSLFQFSHPLAIGLVGRIDPFKRVLEFLELIALTESRGGQHALYLIIGQPGPADYMAQIEHALRRLNLTHRVLFTGRRDDLHELLPGLDLLVTLSGGSVAFEAMASGTPVFTLRRTARPPYYIRHDINAWSPETHLPNAAAADALGTLLNTPALRQRLAHDARLWVEHHHTIPLMTRNTECLYEHLLACS
jgi:glycosyltransferase involved in cell wall biosynthesis